MKLTFPMFMAAILLISSTASGQIAENKTDYMLSQAEKDISEMSDSGFGVVFVTDALLDARKAFNATLYSIVAEKTSLISERKIQAYNISDSLSALNFGIQELEGYGLNTSEIKEFLNRGKIAFQQERYEEAEGLIKQGYTKLTDTRAEATLIQVRIKAVRENMVSLLKDNQTNITVGSVVAAVVAYVTLSRIVVTRTKNRIKDLKAEKSVLKNLMKKAQYEHFQKGILTKESYEIKMNKYKERVREIKELMPVLKYRIRKQVFLWKTAPVCKYANLEKRFSKKKLRKSKSRL
ncbi:MAG: hypothetical protein HY515_00615 [Candidatus Aenigmarchaeota archaeon]|nr:hypothetical protein [Candidatus Aenigmarchaeota archaeon]